MELRHLRYFIAVAEELHFRKAAQRLHLAQPALSQQIKDMEIELGAVLFQRSSRKVELTEAGRILLKESRIILAHLSHAIELVRASKTGDSGTLRIGFVTSAGYSILPSILREFHASRPKVELQCFEMQVSPQIESLRKSEIDVGFVRLPVYEKNIRLYPLLSEGIIMILPKGHPLAEKKNVSLKEFANDPFILHPRQKAPGIYDQIISSCRKVGFTPRVTQESSEMQSILGLVAAGLGISMGPEALQKMQREDLVYKPLGTRFGKFELALAINEENVSPILKSFIEICEKVARSQKKPFEEIEG